MLEGKKLNFEKIFIRSLEANGKGSGASAGRNVAEVRIENAAARLQSSLNEKLASVELAQRTFAWLRPRLMTTLSLDLDATRQAQEAAAEETPQETRLLHAGEDTLARANEPLTSEAIDLLRLEYEASRNNRISAPGFAARWPSWACTWRSIPCAASISKLASPKH